MREYEPIWERLKRLEVNTAKTVGVPVEVHRVLHKRIIKAVKKEKWLDVVFKLAIEPRICTLSHTIKGNVITFFLTRSLTEEDF